MRCLRFYSTVDMNLVKQLRAETKAGIMLCRDSLLEANNDIEKARKILRSKGVKTRDGKIASEGLVEMAIGENNRDFAFAVEICCETDFVARGSSVAGLASECTRIGVDEVKGGCANDELLEKVREGTKGPVEDAMRVTGEKVTVRRVWGYQKPGCYISGYLHSPSGLAKVAAIVALESENEVLGSKLAVQVAAMNPKSMEDLLEQPFGAWGTTAESVAQILSKEKSKLASFGRLEVGEGIEHKEDDFVEQVQAAMKQ